MKVLQFGFGDGDGASLYLPHNYEKNYIAYTGTHDNDTFVGWYEETGDEDAILEAKEYLGLNEEEGYNFGFIRGVWNSCADLAIAPMQDFLNLGNETRMNLPSTTSKNWQWRMLPDVCDDDLADKICNMTALSGRGTIVEKEEEEEEEEEE